MQRPLSWRGWKTKPWIKHLSGTTLAPSTASRGAVSWISSMAAIHASLLASQEKNSATKTRDISGLTSPVSSVKSNRRFVSSKMSADIYDWASNKSMMTFDRWVMALRLACLQRRKLGQPTDGSDCSSWLTPRAQETTERQETFLERNGDRTDKCYGSLTGQTALWPTATASDANVVRARPPHKMIRKDGRNVLRTPSLAETVMQPPDFPYTKQDLALAEENLPYTTARIHWPTPRAQEPGSTSSEHGISLNEASKIWPTPRSCAGKRSSGSNRTELVKSWSTPTARDWKDGVLINNNTETRSNLSRQAPRTELGGSSTLNAPRTLNPLFVEALMGWPVGWTDCASAVTGLSLWLQLMRSELSRVLQASTSDQFDLFA